MTDIFTYIKDYCEEKPEWIARYLRGEQITFRDIMSSRVGYYPGSGFDGTLMKVGNKSHSVHSFLYVDYLLKRIQRMNHCLWIDFDVAAAGRAVADDADLGGDARHGVGVADNTYFLSL